MPKKSEVAQAVWGAITKAYGVEGLTKVVVPAEDVTDALLAVMANLLASVEAGERQRIQRQLGPKLNMLIDSVRERPNIILPSRPSDSLLMPQ